METDDYLASAFRTLTRDGLRGGYEPLRWQRRLFERFCRGDVPKYCDLPTGLGKTSVIYLWLIAFQQQVAEGRKERLPRRLVYVVDRRTVVDQATQLAERIQTNLRSLNLDDSGVAVSTLRGHLADNRDWAADPSRLGIIVGTVDMIGSRLLFSGYRSSYKSRPLDAGLLCQDTLLVLDEAHLSEPFGKLVRELSDEGSFQRRQGMPMRVMLMSATGRDEEVAPFKLEIDDLVGNPETNPILKRYDARKRLRIETVDRKKLRGSLAAAASEFAKGGSRVVVFVRQPDEAQAIAEVLRQGKSLLNSVEVLTGTMRGLERDELIEKPVLKRFLDGDETPENRSAEEPAILVSTSAGEVGFDLNADHMVCDAAPLDSMIQRLGRVNRRGHGMGRVRMFASKPDEESLKRPAAPRKNRHTFESATAEAIECLEDLKVEEAGEDRDASPRAIDDLKKRLGAERFLSACTPKPATVDLTDILLDAWSMTTILEPMPGRPPVAAWLRGIAEWEEPETTIAWRAELDDDGFSQLDSDDIEEWFDAHRVLAHETLSVPSSKAAKWIVARWLRLPDQLRGTVGESLCVINRAGQQTVKVRELVEELEGKRLGRILNAEVVMPASFGGIERGEGLLDEFKPNSAEPDFLTAPDVADARGRHRILRFVNGDGESRVPLVRDLPPDGADITEFALDLPSVGDSLRQLVSIVAKRERREFGTKRQALSVHVALVEKHAREICRKLNLPEGDEIRQAVELAAAWHDRGKDRDIWQWAVGRRGDEESLGKSGGRMKRVAGDYRHEFGSLREFKDDREGKIPEEVFDLAMHLIAAHHGRGRPHFPKGGFDPCARGSSSEIGLEVIRRFARLQRKYGYWRLAWMENLLRCADALASSDRLE